VHGKWAYSDQSINISGAKSIDAALPATLKSPHGSGA
jgi:hypothetical protein